MSTEGINILAKIIYNKDYYMFGKLKRKWFIDFELDAYDFTDNFVKEYKKLPTFETFKKEIGMEDLVLVEPLQYYFDKLLKRHKKNMVNKTISKIDKNLSKNDLEGVVKNFEEISENIKEETTIAKEKFFSYTDLLSMSLEESIKNRTRKLLGITTGWKTLDDATGGFTNGNFYAVVARVKMGKSLVLSRMAKYAYKSNKSVLFVSLEMPAVEIANRLLGLEFNINKTLITKGRISTFVGDTINEKIGEIENPTDFWFVDGKFNKTIKDLVFTARHLNPDIIFVDGAYLLRTDNYFKAKWELASYTAEQLKYLAMDLNIPVIGSYQFNRTISRKSSSVKDTGFESIGLSDAISQLASIGIAIIAPDGTDEMRRVEVIGARDGGETSFDINWDWSAMKFSEVDYE